MKICVISSQMAGFGKIGGFGSMTKKLAVSLAEEGHRVSVVVPRKKHQKAVEMAHGITIFGINFWDCFRFKNIMKTIDADIYHSQNPNLFSYLALKYEPAKKHVITCRDPRNLIDWLIETRYATWKRRLKTPLVCVFESGPFIRHAILEASIVGCPAEYLMNKVDSMYGRKDAILLPNIEDFPDTLPLKSDSPLVCFVGRLDKRKRPERIFSLAGKFPNVKFLIIGKAEDIGRHKMLEKVAGNFDNIEMLGYVDKHQSGILQQIYSRSWVLINTSAREGLPMTFIEAAGHGCAILSKVNPDSFATRFGYWAVKDDFEAGLGHLLKDNNWEKSGLAGFNYVKGIYDRQVAVDTHLKVYAGLMEGKNK